jgi:hypothetical protein
MIPANSASPAAQRGFFFTRGLCPFHVAVLRTWILSASSAAAASASLAKYPSDRSLTSRAFKAHLPARQNRARVTASEKDGRKR